MKKYILYIALAGFFCITTRGNSVIRKHDPKNENKMVRGTLDSKTFLTIGTNVALLNSANDFDQAGFIQNITDAGVTIKTPEEARRKFEFHMTGRMNTVLGSPETTQMVTPDIIKIGQTMTEVPHSHAFDKPMFWLREGWMKVYSESGNTFVQCGYFPKQLGLGLVLGNGYKMGTPLLNNNSEMFIDQYRPGAQFQTKFKDGKYQLTGYLGIEQWNSTNVDSQIGMTRSQELQAGQRARYKRKEKKLFQNTFLMSLDASAPMIERSEDNDGSLTVNPFLMYRYDPNQTVEFYADATSRLWTAGASLDFTYKKFFGTVDFAAQVGFQSVKAWDRNSSLNDGSMVLTHLFHIERLAAIAPDPEIDFYTQSSIFPLAQDISLRYEAGEEFTTREAGPHFQPNVRFLNSYSRFRNAYKNNLSGIMLAADCGYEFSDTITFGGIFGLVSGDQNPNDTTEKVLLHRLESSWNDVREDRDHTYFGFQGFNSLYTGRNVHSYYLLRSNRLEHTISTVPELTPNSCTNLGYFGASAKYTGNLESGRSWFVQPSMVFMIQTHKTTFGYDPTLTDTYLIKTVTDPTGVATESYSTRPSDAFFQAANEKLPLALGMEFNTRFEFFDSEDLSLYGSVAVFLPGAHYDGIYDKSYLNQGKIIPLKNQQMAERENQSGIEADDNNIMTLNNHVSMQCYLGVSMNFDSIMQFFNGKKRGRKRERVALDRPMKK